MDKQEFQMRAKEIEEVKRERVLEEQDEWILTKKEQERETKCKIEAGVNAEKTPCGYFNVF